MNRRGFTIGAVAAALLPSSWTKLKSLKQKRIICNEIVDGGRWDCEYFEIKLIANGVPLICDIKETHDGKGICYTVTSGDDNIISMDI